MSRNGKLFWACAIVAVFLAGGKYSAMIILTLLAAIYAWLLASVFLMAFIVLSAIIVPIGQKMVEKHEAAVHKDREPQRKIA